MSALKAIAAVGILLATTLPASAGAPPPRPPQGALVILYNRILQDEREIQNLKDKTAEQIKELQEQQQQSDNFTRQDISALQGRVNYLCQVLVRTGCP
jgi:hypothetical protein